jgi:hypothetical protein
MLLFYFKLTLMGRAPQERNDEEGKGCKSKKWLALRPLIQLERQKGRLSDAGDYIFAASY